MLSFLLFKISTVTGGSGLVGRGIKDSVERDGAIEGETFVYLSSKDANLLDMNATRKGSKKI